MLISQDTVEDIPKKYQLTINKYGNVDNDSIDRKWVTVTLRGHQGEVLRASQNIFMYEVCYGLVNTYKKLYKPELGYKIHKDQLPRLDRETRKLKFNLIKEALKDKKAKAKYLKTPEGIAKKAREIIYKEKSEAQENECRKYFNSIGLNYDQYSKILVDNLDDYMEAHPDWLVEAQDALTYSIQNRGVMRSWARDGDPEYFYSSLCSAISAHRRHTKTSYDSIDKRGMSEQAIKDLRKDAANGLL